MKKPIKKIVREDRKKALSKAQVKKMNQTETGQVPDPVVLDPVKNDIIGRGQ